MQEVQSLEELNAIAGTVLVYIYGTTCGPCKMTAPVVDAFFNFQKSMNTGLTVVKINAEEYPDITCNYAIRSLPSLLLFENGVFQNSRIGSFTGKELMAFAKGN